MYHSIRIGTMNTWDDWHLIPATRPLFNPPAVKTNMVEIPGGDGSIDLTTSITGRPTYNNRTGSWTFYVENGFKEWTALYHEIETYLHGKKLKAILEDDSDYHYEGRFFVNEWKSEKDWSQIVIDYDVGPFKKENRIAGSDWLWDPFNFITGVIDSYRNLLVVGERTVNVEGDKMETVPIIYCTQSGMSMSYEGNTYALSKGANQIYAIVLHNGNNALTFYGHGYITIEYRKGRL